MATRRKDDNGDDDNTARSKPGHPEHPHGGPPGQDKDRPEQQPGSSSAFEQDPTVPSAARRGGHVKGEQEQINEAKQRQQVERGAGQPSAKQKILELYESQGATDDTVILNIQGMQLKVGDLR